MLRTITNLLAFALTSLLPLPLLDCCYHYYWCQQQLQIRLRVFDWWFFVRVALEYDLGLARSYMAGEWVCEHDTLYADGLRQLFLLFVDNRDVPNGQGMKVTRLLTSWVGYTCRLTKPVQRLARTTSFHSTVLLPTLPQNASVSLFLIAITVAAAHSDATVLQHTTDQLCEAHYDLSNALFTTFLDTELLMYSSAIYDATLSAPAAAASATLAIIAEQCNCSCSSSNMYCTLTLLYMLSRTPCSLAHLQSTTSTNTNNNSTNSSSSSSSSSASTTAITAAQAAVLVADRDALVLSGTLEEAQFRKVDTLIARARLQKHHKLLDIGFGWGGVALRAAQTVGCRVWGITLSKEQKTLAEERHTWSAVAVVFKVHASATAMAARQHYTSSTHALTAHFVLLDYYCYYSTTAIATSYTDVSPLSAPKSHYKCATFTTATLTTNILIQIEALTTSALLTHGHTHRKCTTNYGNMSQVAAAGLSHLMTFELVDYRVFAKQHPGEFDRIISCEMIEAVGHNYLPSYFAAVERLLAPDGVFVMEKFRKVVRCEVAECCFRCSTRCVSVEYRGALDTARGWAITTPESRYEEYLRSTDFINTIIFPGRHQYRYDTASFKGALHLHQMVSQRSSTAASATPS
eukprot:8870-Heterococcus_DN1.PRE.4